MSGPFLLGDLAQRFGGELHGDPALRVTGFATDGGRATSGDLFIAIRGARVDGHTFIAQARSHGAVAALVERPVDSPHVRVENVVEALAQMAASFRATFAGPVIGITGSAGKTTTKEFVAAALSPLGPILKTEGNRNSEFTSPLLWTELASTHRAVVVEMGMRGLGQIRHLAAFSRPTIGIVTNIGYAHLEQVGSRDKIAEAKGELLEALGPDHLGIVWHEDEYRDTLRARSAAPVRTFGFDEGADCRILEYRLSGWDACEVTGTMDGQRWTASLPVIGRHMALNAAVGILVAHSLGMDIEDAANCLRSVQLPPLRMQITEFRGAKVLMDTYNASPASTAAALETLSLLDVPGRRLAVLGEMRELGEYGERAHRELGASLKQYGIDEAVFLGEPTRFAIEAAIQAGISPDRLLAADNLDDVRTFLERVQPGDAVLVKGSRALELEKALP